MYQSVDMHTRMSTHCCFNCFLAAAFGTVDRASLASDLLAKDNMLQSVCNRNTCENDSKRIVSVNQVRSALQENQNAAASAFASLREKTQASSNIVVMSAI